MNPRLAVACVYVCTITGCGSEPVITSENLASQWGDRFRAYQIYPVFPPREDVQVGDLYAICRTDTPVLKSKNWQIGGTPEAVGYRPVSNWLGRMPELKQKLLTQYQDSIALPPSAATDAPGKADTQGTGAMPEASMLTDTASSTIRMRNVSLPEFFSASITQAQIGAFLPIGVVLGELGIGSDDLASISVSVPSAGSYGLPAWDAIESARGSALWLNARFWKWASAAANQYAGNCKAGDKVTFLLVTQIYAAYSIDVNFVFSQATAGKARLALEAAEGTTRKQTLDRLSKYFPATQPKEQTVGDSPAGEKVTDASTKQGTAETPPASAATNAAEKLATALAALKSESSQQFPGIQAQIVAGSSSGVTVNRKFTNPVVIGYRGVAFDPDRNGNAPLEPIFPEVGEPMAPGQP